MIVKFKSLTKTNIGLKIPKNYYGRICPRSSWAIKYTGVSTGVIDSGFQGNISVAFFNFFNKFYHVQISNRIAQIDLEKIAGPIIEEVYEFDDDNENIERGNFRFGPTDLK